MFSKLLFITLFIGNALPVDCFVQKKDYSAIAITQLPLEAWQQYKALRLESLQTDPLAFCSSYAEEIDLPEAVWRERMGDMWFAIINDEPIGMIGLYLNDQQALKYKATVIAVWVKPAWRCQGIAKKMLQEMQKIARMKGYVKLFLEVLLTQTAAITLYQSAGFRNIGLLEKEIFKEGQYFDEYAMEWLC